MRIIYAIVVVIVSGIGQVLAQDYGSALISIDQQGSFGRCVQGISPDSVIILVNSYETTRSGIGIASLSGSGELNWSNVHYSEQYSYYPGGISSVIRHESGYLISGVRQNAETDAVLFYLTDQGDSSQFTSYQDSSYQVGVSISRLEDSTVLMTGTSYKYDPNGDLFVWSVNSNGEIQWHQEFGSLVLEEAASAVATKDTALVIAGNQNKYMSNIYLQKVDKNGGPVWNRTIGGNYRDRAFSILQSEDMGYLISGHAGDTLIGNVNTGDYYGRPYLVKVDENGHLDWNQRYLESNLGAAFTDAIELSGEGYVVSGYQYVDSMNLTESLIFKVDSIGNKIWSRSFRALPDSNSISVLQNIVQDSANGFWAVGFHRRLTEQARVWFLHLDSNGCISDSCLAWPADIFSPSAEGTLEFDLFPNPANSEFRVVTNQEYLGVEVLDMSGRRWLYIDYQSSHVKFSTEQLPSGVYLVRLIEETGLNSRKLIIRH